MTNSDTGRVALVAGGSGIVGHSVAMELERQGWRVRTLARRPIAATNQISEIITDPFHECEIGFEDATIRLRRQVATWRIFEQVL